MEKVWAKIKAAVAWVVAAVDRAAMWVVGHPKITLAIMVALAVMAFL